MNSSTIPDNLRHALWVAHDYKCAYCSAPIDLGNLHIDHIIPQRYRGDPCLPSLLTRYNLPRTFEIDHSPNLLPSHCKCNMRKGGRLFDDHVMLVLFALAKRKVPRVAEELKRLKAKASKDKILSVCSAILSEHIVNGRVTLDEAQAVWERTMNDIAPGSEAVATSPVHDLWLLALLSPDKHFTLKCRFKDKYFLYFTGSPNEFRDALQRCLRGRPVEWSVAMKTEYEHGRFRISYNASRVAAYLYESTAPSRSVACLTGAMSALRPIRRGDCLAIIIREVERLCMLYRIDAQHRWLFLDRFSLVLFDYCKWELSEKVAACAHNIYNNIKNGMSASPLSAYDSDSSFRRMVMIKALTGALTDPVDMVLDKLEMDADAFKNNHSYNSFATNLDVAAKIALEVKSDEEKAHEYSAYALSLKEDITHKWVLQEHMVREAFYFHGKNDRRRTLEVFAQAVQMFNFHPLILEPSLDMNGPRKRILPELMQRLNITEEVLLIGGTQIQGHVNELPLELTDSEITDIIKNVI